MLKLWQAVHHSVPVLVIALFELQIPLPTRQTR